MAEQCLLRGDSSIFAPKTADERKATWEGVTPYASWSMQNGVQSGTAVAWMYP
jgi:hypothetical protein